MLLHLQSLAAIIVFLVISVDAERPLFLSFAESAPIALLEVTRDINALRVITVQQELAHLRHAPRVSSVLATVKGELSVVMELTAHLRING